MRSSRWKSPLLLAAVALATTGALRSRAGPGLPAESSPAELLAPDEAREVEAGAEAFLRGARERLPPDAPVAVAPDCPDCPKPIRLSAEFLRERDGRPFALLLPRRTIDYNVDVEVHFRDRVHRFESLHVSSNRRDDHSLWLTTLYSKASRTYDYFLALELGPGFEARATGTLQDNRILDWSQNNEYRLLVLRAPRDPDDPRFALILQDELRVNVVTTATPGSFIPSVRPSISFRPANLGVSMTTGKRGRFKVSVGGGFALSALPFADPASATQGFLRLQFRP